MQLYNHNLKEDLRLKSKLNRPWTRTRTIMDFEVLLNSMMGDLIPTNEGLNIEWVCHRINKTWHPMNNYSSLKASMIWTSARLRRRKTNENDRWWRNICHSFRKVPVRGKTITNVLPWLRRMAGLKIFIRGMEVRFRMKVPLSKMSKMWWSQPRIIKWDLESQSLAFN